MQADVNKAFACRMTMKLAFVLLVLVHAANCGENTSSEVHTCMDVQRASHGQDLVYTLKLSRTFFI